MFDLQKKRILQKTKKAIKEFLKGLERKRKRKKEGGRDSKKFGVRRSLKEKLLSLSTIEKRQKKT